MAIPPRVTIVTLGALDMALLRSFYRALGWAENDGASDDYASFDTGGARLALFPVAALLEDVGWGGSPAGPRPWGVTLAINLDSREAVSAAVSVARAAGATILKEPADAFWGGYSAGFADPEGNLWEIAWAPGTTFDDRGGLLP
jgi:predicted lactoylglutathione lyase